VDDPDVQVLDEQQDGLPGVLAADADVVELAGVAEGDGSDAQTLSVRTRSWVSAARSPGAALGRPA
jgi:hypothetical protein